MNESILIWGITQTTFMCWVCFRMSVYTLYAILLLGRDSGNVYCHFSFLGYLKRNNFVLCGSQKHWRETMLIYYSNSQQASKIIILQKNWPLLVFLLETLKAKPQIMLVLLLSLVCRLAHGTYYNSQNHFLNSHLFPTLSLPYPHPTPHWTPPPEEHTHTMLKPKPLTLS